MDVINDVRISKTAVINHPDLVTIGKHVSIDMGVYIATAAKIGDYVHIATKACVIGGRGGYLEMADFTNISVGSTLIVVSDDFTDGMINPIVPLKYRRLLGGVIKMGRFCTIGVNCTVLQNVNMAEGSILGANSLLTKSTEPWGIYAGSPAKRIGTRKKEWILASAKELGYEY